LRRRQALKAEVFDVGDRVAGITDMLRTVMGSRIKLEIEVHDEAPFVEADAAQFDTALVNMAVNARDAMEGEGTLTITVNRLQGGQAGEFSTATDFVTVSVADTGSGIAPADLQRIFEPFFTTKEVGQGTGLGLSQVYGFAKQSGGGVDVQSTLGSGTTFTLALPRTAARMEPVREDRRPAQGTRPRYGLGRRGQRTGSGVCLPATAGSGLRKPSRRRTGAPRLGSSKAPMEASTSCSPTWSCPASGAWSWGRWFGTDGRPSQWC
jgi:hypothetical protein